MYWDFDLNEEKSIKFLKYFFKKQKDNVLEALSGSGTRFINCDNNYEYHLEYNFKIDNEEVKVNWIIVTTIDNCLLKISTVGMDKEIDEQLNKMIHDCLILYINEVKTSYFSRLYYSIISGCNLAGEYWFNNIRIAPLFVDDDCKIYNSERIIVIDQMIDAIDKDEARKLAYENAENIVSLLSFIMDISIEEPTQSHKYFLNNDNNTCQREIAYFFDNNCPSTMPKKKVICRTAEFEGSILNSHNNIYNFNEVLKLPKETRKFINGVMNSDEELKKAVLNFSKLYRISKFVGTRYSTSEISYQCAGIESISKFSKEKSFSDFMKKYFGDNKELYDFIYGTLRSGHFHSGEFDFYDFALKPNHFYNPNVLQNENIKKNCHIAMRVGFIYWLDSKIGILEK